MKPIDKILKQIRILPNKFLINHKTKKENNIL